MSEPLGESWGDSPHRKKYRPLAIDDQVEDVENYRIDGFAPVTVGDQIGGGKYSIISKLGHGGIAMVWLCYDEEERKWCAIKINAAYNSSINCGDLKAIRLMKMKGIDAARVNKLCYQVAKGMCFLHQNGLVHGDFRPQNMLMRLKPNALDLFSKDDMYKLLGEPMGAELLMASGIRSRHAPRYVVTSASWKHFSPVVTDEIAIVDFGEAYLPSAPPSHFGIPSKYASPEIIFEKTSSGYAGDIWSLGLTLMELRLNNYGEYSAPHIVRFMERFVGTIPAKYRSAAKKYLTEEGWKGLARRKSEDRRPFIGPVDVPLNSVEERESENTSFVDRLMVKLASEQQYNGEEMDPDDRTGRTWRRAAVKCHLPEDEVRLLGGLLHQMLRYDPGERIPIEKVLEHPWFQISREQDQDQQGVQAIQQGTGEPEQKEEVSSVLQKVPWTLTKAVALWPIFIRLLVIILLYNVTYGLYTWLNASSWIDACTVTMIFIHDG